MARKPTYRYVPLKGCFVSIADGHKVNPRNVRRAFDAVMDKALASARRAAVQLDNETISPDQFAERMARLTRATHVVGAKLGAGTKRRARSAATRGRVEERLAFQMEKLTLFVDEAADGDIARGSLIRRAQMYVTSGTQTFEDERRRVVQGRGEMQYERRHINSSIPCGDCIGYSALGWQPIGTLPLPGQDCECMSACRCSFEYAEEIPGATFAYDPNQPRDEQGQWTETGATAGIEADLFFEVAPSKSVHQSAAWHKQAQAARARRTRAIVNETLPDILKDAGIDPETVRIEHTIGGFELETNPSVRVGLRASKEEIDKLARGIGYVYRQDSVLVARGDVAGETDYVHVQFPKGHLNAKTANEFFQHAATVDPTLGGGFAARDDAIVFYNVRGSDGPFSGHDPDHYYDLVKHAVETYDGADHVEIGRPDELADVTFVENDWRKYRHGEGYRSATKEGRPEDTANLDRTRAKADARHDQIAEEGRRRAGLGRDKLRHLAGEAVKIKRRLVAQFHGDPERDGAAYPHGGAAAGAAEALAPASTEHAHEPEAKPAVDAVAIRRKRNKAALARGREDRKHPDRARHQINAEALMLRPLEFEATRGGFVAVDRVGEGLDHLTEGTLGALPPDSNPVHRKRRFLASVLPTLRAQLNRPGSAIDWYRQAIDRTMRVMTEVFPNLADDTNAKFFKLLLGPTSPQNTPLLNLDKAADIFEAYFASGDSDATRRIPMFKADGVTKWGTKGVYDAIDRFHSLVDAKGFEGAVDWLVSPQPIGTPTNPAVGTIRWQKKVDPGDVGAPSRDGPKYGTEKGSRFEHRVPGALVFGPKAGRFALNILQFAKEVTIDVWAARTWNRVQGSLMGWVTLDGKDLDIFNGKTAAAQGREGVDWQVHPDPKKAAKGARRVWGVVDQPRGEGERKLMIESFTEAATILSEELSARDGVKRVIDPMDVQALLWFAEQDLWRAHGAKNDSWSFDQAAVAYARKRGIEPDTTGILARPNAGAGRANGKGRDAGDATGGVRRGDARPDTGPDQRDGVKPKRRRKKILAKIEALYSAMFGFNPDQPRDEHGRWAETPGSGATAETYDGDEYFSDEAWSDARAQTGPMSREILIHMSPDDFLSMAARAREPDPRKLTRVRDILADGEKLLSIPWLGFEHDGAGRATAAPDVHDGRHRAMVLKSMGVKHMPVRFRSEYNGIGASIRWGRQGKGDADRITQEWPRTLRGDFGHAHNVIPFPVPDLRSPASDPAMYSRDVTDLPGQFRGETYIMDIEFNDPNQPRDRRGQWTDTGKVGDAIPQGVDPRRMERLIDRRVKIATLLERYRETNSEYVDQVEDELKWFDREYPHVIKRMEKDSEEETRRQKKWLDDYNSEFSANPIDFSASVETTPGVRTGKIFEVGAWPEKNFALTPEEMAQAIEEFEPVPIDLEHKRTVFDGASSGAGIGRLSEIWAADSGRTLMGRVEFTDWATKALHGVKLPVSCAWQYVKTASGDTAKKITKLSLTVDPAITDAELTAAFSAEPIERIAAVHKLFSGEHAHDINPAPTGAPTEGKPMTVATEPGAAVKPESFAAKLFSLFKSATPEELAEVGAPMGAAFAGASAAAPAKAPAAVVAESKAEADLKARIVALEAEARTEKAVNFTRSLIERNVILPAQAPALAGLYEQALKDDGDGTTVTFGKDKVGTRAQSIEAMFAEAPDHGLTKEHAETIKSGGAALLFADFGGKGGKCAPGMTKSAGMEEDEEEMDDEERMSLLGKSTLGKRAMSAKSKK